MLITPPRHPGTLELYVSTSLLTTPVCAHVRMVFCLSVFFPSLLSHVFENYVTQMELQMMLS